MSESIDLALNSGFMLAETYRIEKVLGVGGFGVTYLATDLMLDRHVAIKEYLPTDVSTRDPERTSVLAYSDQARKESFLWGLEQFLKEAQTLATLSHPNIVPVHRYFKAHNTAYLVMSFIEGPSLESIVKDNGPMSADELRIALRKLMDALGYIHERNLLHRDITPRNILMNPERGPVLIDFGSARHVIAGMTKPLTVIVSSGYAPFEQYSSEGHQGPWTDIYSLAGTMYFAATEQKPPPASDRMIRDQLPVLREVAAEYPAQFSDALMAGLQPRPEQRPQSINDWKERFNETLVTRGERRAEHEERRKGPLARVARVQPSGRTIAVVLLALIVLTVGTVSGIAISRAWRPPIHGTLGIRFDREVLVSPDGRGDVRRLEQAFRRVRDNGTTLIQLSPGEHLAGDLVVPPGAYVWSPSDATVRAPQGTLTALIFREGLSTLDGVTVVGPQARGANAAIASVLIEEAATVTLRNVDIRRSSGYGLRVTAGGSATMTGGQVEQCMLSGVVVDDGGQLTAQDAVSRQHHDAGWLVMNGGLLVAERCVGAGNGAKDFFVYPPAPSQQPGSLIARGCIGTHSADVTWHVGTGFQSR